MMMSYIWLLVLQFSELSSFVLTLLIMPGRSRFGRSVLPRNLRAQAYSENQVTKFPQPGGKSLAGHALKDRDDEETASESEENSGGESGGEAGESDADAPHTIQWVDEDEFEEDNDEEQGGAGPSQSVHRSHCCNCSISITHRSLVSETTTKWCATYDYMTLDNLSSCIRSTDISTLPFGALRKAQSILDREEALTETDNSEDESNDTSSEEGTSDRNVIAKLRKDIAKRSHKHASV
jgi:ribosomal RNA-processing protein 36